MKPSEANPKIILKIIYSNFNDFDLSTATLRGIKFSQIDYLLSKNKKGFLAQALQGSSLRVLHSAYRKSRTSQKKTEKLLP